MRLHAQIEKKSISLSPTCSELANTNMALAIVVLSGFETTQYGLGVVYGLRVFTLALLK